MDKLSLRNALLPPGPWSPYPDRRLVRIDIEDGRIARVVEEPAAAQGASAVDVDGACVLPGLVDAHTHLGWAAEDFWTVPWHEVTCQAEALASLEAVRQRVPDGFWVLGGDWLPDVLPDAELPALADLDAVTHRQPLLLVSRDRSRAVLNSRALELCKIDRTTADPPGGRIHRDAQGEPTGRLYGEAVWGRLAVGVVPPRDRRRQLAELRSLMADLAGRGITEVHDIGGHLREEAPLINLERSFTDLGLLEELARRDELAVRVSYRPSLLRVDELRHLPAASSKDGELITFAGFKMSLDNGWFSEPEGPRIDSFRYPGKERAAQLCAVADELGAAVSIHAIGDLGVAEALDLIGDMRGRRGTGLPPHRVIHARRMAEADVARCAELGVVVEVQPWEIVGAGRSLIRRGSQAFACMLSPYRSLLDRGVPVLISSDRRLGMRVDLRDCDPLTAIQIAVTREDPTRPADDTVFQPEQRITVTEALACSTRAPAVAAGAAANRGRIAAGYQADLVVLGDDPTRVAPSEIAGIPVRLTLRAGRVVRNREEVRA